MPWSGGRVQTPSPRPLLPEVARRVAAWCVVLLLVAGVAAVAIWLCVVFQTAVTPVLLAILGTALLGPLYRRLLRMKVRKSLAAGLTVLAVLGFVGGATYIVVLALIETGDQIIASLRQAAVDIADHLGAAGTSIDDLAKNAKALLEKFGGTAASGVLSGLSVVAQVAAMGVLALLLIFFFLKDSDKAAGALRSLAPARPATRWRPWAAARSRPSRGSCAGRPSSPSSTRSSSPSGC